MFLGNTKEREENVMKCPKCGQKLRQSKKNPDKMLCDNCRKGYWIDDLEDDYEEDYSPKGRAPKKEKKKGKALKIALIVIGVMVVLGIIGSIFGDNSPQKVDNSSPSAENNAEEQTQEEKTTFTVGETAEMNDVQVAFVNYEESFGSEYNTPTDGNVFVLANFEITNNSDSELTISSLMSFEAYADDYALNYSLSALMEKGDSTQLDGTIAPGKKLNGWIGYEVPADWSKVEIHFTDNVWSNNKFVFEISK